MHATTAGGDNELFDSSESGGILQSTQTSGNSEAQSGQVDLQEGEGNNPIPGETSGNTEYLVNKVVDHDYEDEKLFL